MIRLDLLLPADVSVALHRYASLEAIDIDLAAVIAIREWLIHVGYLELSDEISGDTPAEHSA